MTKLTLILPDIHHRVDQADKIINSVGADEVICVGDVFDDFSDTPEMVKHTSEWFVDFINKPNVIYIAGNHDCHYAYPDDHLKCSGYEQWKSFMINDIVSRKDWDKMKWYHILDGKWLISHAGLHSFYLPKDIAALHEDRPMFFEKLDEYLSEETKTATRANSWVSHAGHSRGGMQRVGGLDWNDHNREMYPISGLNQIYGHSPQQHGNASWLVLDTSDSQPYFVLNEKEFKPKIDNVNRSYNLCLDVWKNTHWAIWNGKKLKIFNYRDDL